jgi:hypothetical protein
MYRSNTRDTEVSGIAIFVALEYLGELKWSCHDCPGFGDALYIRAIQIPK